MQTNHTSSTCYCRADYATSCASTVFIILGVALIAIAIASRFPAIQRYIGMISSPVALGCAGLVIGLAGLGGCCQNGMPLEHCRKN